MRFQTLRQQAYLLLRSKLVAGELPAGAPLTETTLAKELGMSRTPIREAIRQMEMEGMVEYAPRFGAVVRVPNQDELAEMYTVREALESYAAAEAARRITETELGRLERLLARMKEIEDEFVNGGDSRLDGKPLQRFLATDLEFHEIVVHASGNRYMAKILESTRLLSRIFRSTLWIYDRAAVAQANQFHARLFEALRQRDPEAARQCTIEAMQVSRRNAMERRDDDVPDDGANVI
ncbi:MAG: GntR family transcriptional regulator [Pirellulales bacterium]